MIFWEFIEAERNFVLKEYNASILEWIPKAGTNEAGTVAIRDILIGTDLYSPADAVKSGLIWWEQYLDKVETIAARARTAAKS